MDPIAFEIGPLQIRWYGIAMALSMLLGAFIAARLLRRIGRNGDLVWDGLFWIILAGVVGARVVYVATNLSAFGADPWEMFKVWHGGLSFHGGIIAGLIATYYFFQSRWTQYSMTAKPSAAGSTAGAVPPPPTFIEVMDAFAPGVSLGIILVRFGNYMNGDILGYKWDGLWAMNFPYDALHNYGTLQGVFLRHPTEVYGMVVGLICLLVSMVLWIETYETQRLPAGAAYMGFIVCYSLVRGLIEDPFRDVGLPWKVIDPAVSGAGFLTSSQIASFFLILLGIWGFTQLRKWERRRQAAAASGGAIGVSRQARRAQLRERGKRAKD